MTETRLYPLCCTSAFCGGFGDSCLTCRNKSELDEFKAWVERTKAVRTDPIWCPRVHVGKSEGGDDEKSKDRGRGKVWDSEAMNTVASMVEKNRASRLVTSCKIGPYPKSLFDPMPKVRVVFDDGEERVLFDFFPDEISFREDEFVGLTEDEAEDLKFKKDKAYLQS